jgi:hypothetical protein
MKIIITITMTLPDAVSENSIAVFRRRAPEVLRHDLLTAIKAATPEDKQAAGGGEVEVVIK